MMTSAARKIAPTSRTSSGNNASVAGSTGSGESGRGSHSSGNHGPAKGKDPSLYGSSMAWPAPSSSAGSTTMHQPSGESAGESPQDGIMPPDREQFFDIAMEQASNHEQRQLAMTFRELFKDKKFDPHTFEVDFERLGELVNQFSIEREESKNNSSQPQPQPHSQSAAPQKKHPAVVPRSDSGSDQWVVNNAHSGEKLGEYNFRRQSIGLTTVTQSMTTSERSSMATGSEDLGHSRHSYKSGRSSVGLASTQSSNAAVASQVQAKELPGQHPGPSMMPQYPKGVAAASALSPPHQAQGQGPPPTEPKNEPVFDLDMMDGMDGFPCEQMADDLHDSATITSEITGLTGIFSEMPTDFEDDEDFQDDPYLEKYKEQVFEVPASNVQAIPDLPDYPLPHNRQPYQHPNQQQQQQQHYQGQQQQQQQYFPSHQYHQNHIIPPHQYAGVGGMPNNHNNNISNNMAYGYQAPPHQVPPQRPPPPHRLSRVGSTRQVVLRSNMRRMSRPRGLLKVSFSEVTVREYDRILSDNPACQNGPSIGIGWRYRNEYILHVDEHEHSRGRAPRKTDELVLNRVVREHMLRDLGYSQKQMAMAVRINNHVKNQRKQTVHNLSAAKVEEIMESAGGALFGALRRRRK